jgi:hypothetical protein
LQRIIQGIKNITALITVHFCLLLFVVNNKDYFVANVVYHNNTRQTSDLHLPQVTLAMHQKGVYNSGIKTFSGLPKAIKTCLQQT